MTLENVITNKLDKMGIVYESNPLSEWISCQCINPEHDDEHPSAGINKSSGVFNCFSCGHTEKFIKDNDVDEDIEDVLWQAKYNNLLTKEEKDELSSVKITLPPKAHSIKEPWRGISVDLLDTLGVYYCSQGRYKGRYVFPMYDINNKLVGFDARIVDDTALVTNAKWLRPKNMLVQDIVYPISALKVLDKDYVIITEGVMDAISYIQMGLPAIPSFGLSAPSQKRIETLLSLGVEDVVIAFDNDEKGIEGALRVIPEYNKWFNIIGNPMVNLVRIQGYKDANDFLVASLKKGGK